MKVQKILLVVSVIFSGIHFTSCKSFFPAKEAPAAREPSAAGFRPDAFQYDRCSEFLDSEDYTPVELVVRIEQQKKCRAAQALKINVSHEGVYYPYLSELSESLTPQLEAFYDVFLLINTDDSYSSQVHLRAARVPKQHVRVVVKKNRGTMDPADNIFLRDSSGKIVGIDETKIDVAVPELSSLNEIPKDLRHYQQMNVPYLVPSTTGGGAYMKTVNGLYLVNEERSASHRNVNPQAPMSYQTYINTRYRDGRESGIAIHGTPSKLRSRLGVSRGSHGCARVHPEHAKAISNYVRALPQRQVPRLGWKNWLSFELQPSVANDMTTSVPVMFVMFNGYDPSLYPSYALNKRAK